MIGGSWRLVDTGWHSSEEWNKSARRVRFTFNPKFHCSWDSLNLFRAIMVLTREAPRSNAVVNGGARRLLLCDYFFGDRHEKDSFQFGEPKREGWRWGIQNAFNSFTCFITRTRLKKKCNGLWLPCPPIIFLLSNQESSWFAILLSWFVAIILGLIFQKSCTWSKREARCLWGPI